MNAKARLGMGFAANDLPKKTPINPALKTSGDPKSLWDDDDDLDEDEDRINSSQSPSKGAASKQKMVIYTKVKTKIQAAFAKSWGEMDRLMKDIAAGGATSADYDDCMKGVAL